MFLYVWRFLCLRSQEHGLTRLWDLYRSALGLYNQQGTSPTGLLGRSFPNIRHRRPLMKSTSCFKRQKKSAIINSKLCFVSEVGEGWSWSVAGCKLQAAACYTSMPCNHDSPQWVWLQLCVQPLISSCLRPSEPLSRSSSRGTDSVSLLHHEAKLNQWRWEKSTDALNASLSSSMSSSPWVFKFFGFYVIFFVCLFVCLKRRKTFCASFPVRFC